MKEIEKLYKEIYKEEKQIGLKKQLSFRKGKIK